VPWQDWGEAVALTLINLLFLVTGLVIFLLKPEDKQAWLLALMLATIAAVRPDSLEFVPPLFARIAAIGRICSSVFLAVSLHFFLIFPQRSPVLRRFPWLEKHLYWLAILIILPWYAVGDFRGIFPVLEPAWKWMRGTPGFDLTSKVVAIGYMAATMMALFINYRAASPLARRKLNVIAAGAGLGLLNFFLLPTVEFTGISRSYPFAGWLVNKTLLITWPLVPLSFAYAIFRHQVIPVGVLLRRSARYLLVSRGAIMLEVLLVIITVTVLLGQITANWKSSLAIRVFAAAVGIAVWNIARRLHQRYLAPVIDRRFFRQSYDAQQIIADLTDQLRLTVGLNDLLELVATKIQSALQTESVTIFLKDSATGHFHDALTTRTDSNSNLSINITGKLKLKSDGFYVQQLSDNALPLDVELRQSDNGIKTQSEVATLLEVNSALLLPLSAKNEMLGIISLGPRLGDLPFSGEDKKLLQSVAGPAAFAIENARLMERAIEDARRRKELEAENEQRAKELEEARQLQLSMLPKSVPQMPNLEIAAYMKTATEVGGDYYDFHLSDKGELTIVVGDATGHGLKAGTVVTAAKSLFNHLAETPDVTELFHQSSRALKQMNMRSLFMAMTIARINGDLLTLSSAGMPPVLIYRAESGEVEEVKLTGIPLGSVTSYRYRQQQLKLSSGDVIVLMSDGFPERFNPEGEMIGYEQAQRSLAESASQSAQVIIERYIRDAEAWAEGYPQDDDVTFVVIKIR